MLKRLLAVGLLTGLALPALAQSAPPAGAFLTTMPPEAMRLSKFRGVDVVGSDVTTIGEIEDVLVGRDGRVQGILMDVGGFLGIGGKRVAVPFEAMLWNFEASPTDGPSSSNTGAGLRTQMAPANDPMSPGANTTGSVAAPGPTGAAGGSATNAATSGTGGSATNAAAGAGPAATQADNVGLGAVTPGTGGPMAAGGPGPLTPMARGSGSDTAGRTGMEAAMGGTAPAGSATVPVTGGSAPSRAVLRMTKQELQHLPEFGRDR